MGYTHYWNMEKVTAEDVAGYQRTLPLLDKIFIRYKNILAHESENGQEQPFASEKEIIFNGIGENAHETFVFRCPEVCENTGGDPALRDFCKTARKPYDLVVCLCLLTLAAHMPNLQLSSDGFSGMLADCEKKAMLDGQWEEAIDELKKYGIFYETKMINSRPPYCDLAPVLVQIKKRMSRLKNNPSQIIAEVQPFADSQAEMITCSLCGYSGVQLLSHLREEHDLSFSEYQQRYYGYPVFSAGFLDFAKQHNLRIENDTPVIDHGVLGVTITRPLKTTPHVPHEDSDYYFDDKAPYVLRSLLDGDRILLVGHTGCGKSSLIEQLAARINYPVRRFNLHGEVSAADFIGQWVMEEGKMLYRYGVLPSAMKQGQILVLEELDAADPSVLFILQGVLEDNGKLVIPDNGGEIIEPHKDFRLCATANTLGLGDDTGLYAGTRVLNASHLDRWSAVFELSYLPPDLEMEMLCRKVSALPRQTAERLVNLANAVRKAASEEQLCCTFSTRRLLTLAGKSIAYNSLEKALAVTVLSKLTPSDRAVVAEIAQRIL